jgi:hypothetical protein
MDVLSTIILQIENPSLFLERKYSRGKLIL